MHTFGLVDAMGETQRRSTRQQRKPRWLVPSIVFAACGGMLSPTMLLFTTPSSLTANARRHTAQHGLISRPVRESRVTAAASLTLDPRQWAAPASPDQKLSPRDWIKMYRILGLPEDSSREQVMRATSRLRRKYADDEVALERVERANLMIMTRIVSRSEEVMRQRQKAARMREIGNTPKKLFMKFIGKYLPAGVQDMLEMPDSGHFRRSSALLGVFALMGLCVPTQATNVVGLGAASCLGLVYQRNRPEPVKDEMGNAGAVQKLNFKEMGGAIAVTVLSALLGGGIALGLGYVVDWPLQVLFCTACCFVFWLSALCFKVYGCFETYEP